MVVGRCGRVFLGVGIGPGMRRQWKAKSTKEIAAKAPLRSHEASGGVAISSVAEANAFLVHLRNIDRLAIVARNKIGHDELVDGVG